MARYTERELRSARVASVAKAVVLACVHFRPFRAFQRDSCASPRRPAVPAFAVLLALLQQLLLLLRFALSLWSAVEQLVLGWVQQEAAGGRAGAERKTLESCLRKSIAAGPQHLEPGTGGHDSATQTAVPSRNP